MKRRILHTLKLTEISGVDRPCQEGAKVMIMKRDVVPYDYTSPEYRMQVRLAKMQRRMDRLNKAWDESKHPRDPKGMFTWMRAYRAAIGEGKSQEEAAEAADKVLEKKGNPYHDELGRFATGPGGGAAATSAPAAAKPQAAQRSRFSRALRALGRGTYRALQILDVAATVVGTGVSAAVLASMAVDAVRARGGRPPTRPTGPYLRVVKNLSDAQAQMVLERLPLILTPEQLEAVIARLEAMRRSAA